jgi:hypothetical protein
MIIKEISFILYKLISNKILSPFFTLDNLVKFFENNKCLDFNFFYKY